MNTKDNLDLDLDWSRLSRPPGLKISSYLIYKSQCPTTFEPKGICYLERKGGGERGRQAGQQAGRFKFRFSFGKIEGRYRGIVRHRNKETKRQS